MSRLGLVLVMVAVGCVADREALGSGSRSDADMELHDAGSDAWAEPTRDAGRDVLEMLDAGSDAADQAYDASPNDAAVDATTDADIVDAGDAGEILFGDAGDAGDAEVDAAVYDAGGAGTGGGHDAGAAGSGGTGGEPPVDAGCTERTFYRDADGDTYGDPDNTITACVRPTGYRSAAGDCYDDNPLAKPGQTMWFTEDRGDGSFDYNCDGDGTPRWTAMSPCVKSTDTGGDVGWSDVCLEQQGMECVRRRGVPACGVTANWVVETNACPARSTSVTQVCH